MKIKKLLSTVLATAAVTGTMTFANTAMSQDPAPFTQKDNVISVYDEAKGFYKGMAQGTTAADLLSEFADGHTLKNAKGEPIEGTALIGTDYTICFGEDSRKIVIYGDVNCDTKINLTDVASMLKHIAKWNVSMNLNAADVTVDDKVNLADASRILQYIAKWDVECGFVSWKYDLSKVDAPAEDSTLKLWFNHSAIKEYKTDAVPNDKHAFDMYMAKNEYEGCHVNLTSSTGHKGLSASVTQFKDKAGNTLPTELFFEDYFEVDTGDKYPDRLPPIEVKNGFEIKASETQGLFLKVKTDFDTVPGMYRARVDVKNESGQTIKRGYVYTYVWNFEIPEEPSIKTAYGMSAYAIYTSHNKLTEEHEGQLYERYYEYFLENRITPWCMPFDPTDERADKYMSDPRVTTFLVYGGYAGDRYGNEGRLDAEGAEYVSAAYDKIKDNEDWASKALFYMNDEPRFGDQLNAVESTKGFLDANFPGARVLVPTHVNYFATGDLSDVNTGFDNEGKYPAYADMDTYGIVDKFTTVLCPSVRLFTTPDMTFDGQIWYTQKATDTFGTLRERLEASREAGKEIWWYYAGDDNTALPHSGMVHRTAYWQQYDEDIEGVLCWATNEWQGVSNRPQTQRPLSAGAGLYVYNGGIYKIDGPIACLRTEIMRDGMEDVEYLVLAEELFGKDVADEYNHKITTDMVTFEKDAYVLEDIRRELGTKIEAAVNEK
ncbi:MAG: DUF4091 domain-containing protein [Ruminococcaceae bacterium]|nr:DUF4091 domain-containing protein [Oscillospiraceae bacterium]